MADTGSASSATVRGRGQACLADGETSVCEGSRTPCRCEGPSRQLAPSQSSPQRSCLKQKHRHHTQRYSCWKGGPQSATSSFSKTLVGAGARGPRKHYWCLLLFSLVTNDPRCSPMARGAAFTDEQTGPALVVLSTSGRGMCPLASRRRNLGTDQDCE